MKTEPSTIRVLIADDDAMVCEVIQRLLERSGYDVVGEAADGRQAVELTHSLHPDVVLLDLKMPEMDGITAARQIQKRCPTPVVVLTAYDPPELVRQASAAGVGAFLLKPPDARQLERAITIAMARHADLMELRRLGADLDAYADAVAHDLKNPLTLVMGFTELLVEDLDHRPPAELREYLQRIMYSTSKMNNIIEGLLWLARARGETIRRRPLDMATIVTEAQRRLARMITEHQAEIHLPAEWPPALGHALGVEEVWVNYLTNAIEYGGHPPIVELGGEVEAGGMVRFWVKDNGSGISPEVQAALFNPPTLFSDNRVKGHGVGLLIVKRIVEKIGGQVGMQSEVGHGSLFYFTLPGAGRPT
jgi:signal transduction histidine kinase